MDEGIDYRPNGEIHIRFDGDTYRLARPKLRTYRWLSERLEELRTETGKVSDRIVELQTELASEGADEERIQAEISELNQPMYVFLEPVLRQIVERVGDRPLPEDVDDWPPWLAFNALLPAEILSHWRTVPKAPGAAGTN